MSELEGEADQDRTSIAGIVKDDPLDRHALLFALHDDASSWTSIPRSMVQDIQASGATLRGLDPACRSVVLSLAPPESDQARVLARLVGLHAQCLGGPDLFQCYDQNGKNIAC